MTTCMAPAWFSLSRQILDALPRSTVLDVTIFIHTHTKTILKKLCFIFNLSQMLLLTEAAGPQRSPRSLHSLIAVPCRPTTPCTHLGFDTMRWRGASIQGVGGEKKKDILMAVVWIPQSSSDLPPEWQHPCGASIHPNGCNLSLHLSCNCP